MERSVRILDEGNNAKRKAAKKCNSKAEMHTVIVPINNANNANNDHKYHPPSAKDLNMQKTVNERESAVLVRDLCKGYDKHGPRVLNNFNMNVKKGTIYGLLGSSGCGKTTALSCIVGLKEWESGEVGHLYLYRIG